LQVWGERPANFAESPLRERIKEMETNTAVVEEQATPGSGAKLIREVRRKTRQRFSTEDKIRIVLEGFRKEIPVTDLCRQERISAAVYYAWLKDFMEAGKTRLRGDTLRSANENEVKELRVENDRLKALAGEQALQLQLLKKSLKG